MLTIRLFGNVQILVDGNPISITRRKSRALLYYIAAHAEPVSRIQLLALLWTDHDDQAARNNLRSTLYSLRQAMGDWLVSGNDQLALADGASVDVRFFASTLGAPTAQIQSLTNALEQYRGDFLREFSLPDAPEYEEWVAAERQQYQRMAIRGFAKLSRLQIETGDYHAALTSLQKALTLDPFQEDLQRESLYLHYLAGDRAGAIRRFSEMRQLLEDELGVPPMAETQALYDAIITDQDVPTPYGPQPRTESIQPHSTLATPSPFATERVPQQPETLPKTSVLKRHTSLGIDAQDQLPFAGRTDELAMITAAAGSGKLVLVEGEPGVGKTRLLHQYLRNLPQTDDRPLLIFMGRAHELEGRLPYQPIIEALRALPNFWNWNRLRQTLQLPDVWRNEVARMLPELFGPELSRQAALARSPDESRLWEGLFQFLTTLAQQTELYFFIDDLHWADVATLGILGYLIRQTAQSNANIHFLAASQPVAPRAEISTLLQSLLREDLLQRIALERLSENDVTELARILSPNFGHPLARWLMRGSEGNPFILEELVRYARQHQILTSEGAVDLAALPASPVVPQTIYSLIQSRLEQLSEGARRVLDAAVALGREFEFEVAARAAALSDTAALDALDELRRARLIHTFDESRFVFDHSLIMEVAYREVGEPRHRLLHRRLAAALESLYQHQLDEVAGLIAQHYIEGNAPELASAYARRAGDRATRLAAWQAASGFYRQALTGAAQADHSAILIALAHAQLYAGGLDQAEAAAREALARAQRLAPEKADINIIADVLAILAEVLLLQARFGEIIELAQKLHAESTSSTDSGQKSLYQHPAIAFQIQFMWGTALSMQGLHLESATEHLQTAADLLRNAPAAAPLERMAQVDFELGNLEAQRGRLARAVAYYRQTEASTAEMRTDAEMRLHILAHNNLGYHLLLLGDPDALDYARRGLELAREKGMLTLTPYLGSTLGEIAMEQGELASAEGYFNLGLNQAKRFQIPERVAGLTANMGLVAARRGQIERAIQYLRTALEVAESAHTRYLIAQIRIWLAPLLSEDEAAPHLAIAHEIVKSGNYVRLAQQLESIAQPRNASTP